MNGNYAPSANVASADSSLDLPTGRPKSPPTSAYYPSSARAPPPDSSSSSRVPRHTATPDVYPIKSPPTNVPPPSSVPGAPKNPLASLQSAKRKRLPQDKVGQLEDRLALDTRDADAWLALIKEYQGKGKIVDARETYERFLRIFPDLASQWKNYADMELADGEFKKVEEIFQKSLPVAWSVELFQFYLDYIRRRNDVFTGGEMARTTIIQAYEFVISTIGLDKDSGGIWADYLDFVKSSQADAKWKEQQKMDQTRKIYHRAVCIPLENLETLWQGYNAFENDLNKATARKFVAERSPAYMQARSALRQMRTIMGPLNRNKIPRPPTWSPAERQEFGQWKSWIEWEKSNPLVLENQTALYSRVIYAYKQAVMNMRFYPNIFYDAAEYAKSHSQDSESLEFIRNGMAANKLSFLMHYAYAEAQEESHTLSEVRTTYDTLIANLTQEYEKMIKMAEFMRLQLAGEEEADAAGVAEASEAEREAIMERRRRRKVQREMIEREHEMRIEGIANENTNAWIGLMQATRRAEGIKSARLVFGKARKAKIISHHIFVASALMEYHSSDDKTIATKVFELGLKSYADKPDYVLHYLNFLIQINDQPNARALFERTVSKLPTPAAKPLFDLFYTYECEYGDSAAIRKLSKRIADLYPEESNLQRIMTRHTRFGINPIALHDLPPPLPTFSFPPGPIPAQHPVADDAASVSSSRAGSVQPSDIDETSPKRKKIDRFGRQMRERTHSPDARPKKQARGGAGKRGDFPREIVDFVAALPPAGMFDGATFHIDELVRLIRDVNVPFPVGFARKRGREDE